jgi:hypothetical protein
MNLVQMTCQILSGPLARRNQIDQLKSVLRLPFRCLNQVLFIWCCRICMQRFQLELDYNTTRERTKRWTRRNQTYKQETVITKLFLTRMKTYFRWIGNVFMSHGPYL